MIDINEKICTYITKNWLIPWLKENKSQNSFAKNHDIEESTVTQSGHIFSAYQRATEFSKAVDEFHSQV